MIQFFKKVFGKNSEILRTAIQSGATVIDVRTPGEYKTGHVKGSINIPLDKIGNSIAKIQKMNQPIVTCCASGMRSGTAMSLLKNKGIEQVHNGGSWSRVNSLKS